MLEKMRIYNSNFRLIIPAVLVVIGASTLFLLLAMTKHIEHEMHKIAGNTHMILLQQAHDKAHHILLRVNASTFNVAQIIGSLKFTNTSFSSIQNQVFPLLFEAYTMLPLVSQISYVSRDKHMLSYYMDGNQTYALFSNSSNSFVSQKVNITNGESYGEEIALPELQTNASKWFNDALNGTSGYAYWGIGYGRKKQQMLFFTASTPDHNGVVSLGLPMENYRNHVLPSNTYNYGTRMYLSSDDGNIHEYSGVVPHSFQSTSEQINSVCHPKIKNSRRKQLFDCSSFDIGGMKMVVAAITYIKEVINIEYVQALNIGIITLLCILILGLVTESYLMLLMYKNSMKKETCLKANLIKLKEAVQQAERKSMNKSMAFASASHDVRNSLSGITGLIELCCKEVQSSYASMQLNENLVQMQACASDLLGIVNSVLDMSKIEAGKTQLEEAEFDIGQVIEESIDFCNIAALDKGLEVIWDPCNFSILNGGASRVKGDYRRFKQILDNLLGNARKFTQSGHIVLRGWASKQNEYDINHDLIEFVFEVDDTGIGIPKEKKESIFENYVQVKESAFQGQEGTGLGLGIVQSLVRLMGGEIGVIDKVRGEKGACFRFNIFLQAVDINIFESTKGLKEFTETVKARGGTTKSILLVSGDETRRILKHFMENMGIEANIVESWEQVDPTVLKSRRVISKRFRSSGSSNKITASDNKTEDQTLQVRSNDILCTSKRFKDSLSPIFILILIDIDSCGGFSNMHSILDKFSKFKFDNNKLSQFKIVCLVNPNTHNAEINRIKETSCVPLRKPIHGSRLHDIIRMIQEFGGNEEDKVSYIHSEPESKLERSDVEVNIEEQKQLNGMRILLVEDIMVMRVIAVLALSKLGAVVEVAENGLKALNMIKNALQDSSCHCTEEGKNKHLPYDVLMDCEYTPAIDIWSIGCIFAEMLSGKPLFPGKNMVHQLDLITDFLGTPPPETISRIRNEKAKRYLSGMRKKPPIPFSQKFPNADPLALRLLERLIAFDPKDRPTTEEALADPNFKGLANVQREPSTQPISKLEFEFERRKLTKDDVRELIYREILEYHPQMLQEYLCGGEQTSFMYPSGVDRFKRQFAHLEDQPGKKTPVLRQNASLPRERVKASDEDGVESSDASSAVVTDASELSPSALNAEEGSEDQAQDAKNGGNRPNCGARSLLKSASISTSQCVVVKKRNGAIVEETITESAEDEDAVDELSQGMAQL